MDGEMVQRSGWHELHRCTDPEQARAILTTLRAMEFEADDRVLPPAISGGRSMHIILVPEDSLSELVEVLPEIIAEQAEFDRLVEAKASRLRSLRDWFVLIGMVFLFIIMGLAGSRCELQGVRAELVGAER